ncbi:MAG: cupredoxin domain-containing protein [Chloroflexota bacterium]|nr:cupredoxin domain-containing protein [Chloroflexota bacterium]
MYRTFRILAALLLLLAASLTTTPARAAAPAQQGKTVIVEAVDGNKFAPATITINVGDTVTWRNSDPNTPHNSVSVDDLWDSDNLETGDEFSFTFEQAGTYEYVCTYHNGMNGTVIVQAAGQDEEDTSTTGAGDEGDTDTSGAGGEDTSGAGAGDDHEGADDSEDTQGAEHENMPKDMPKSGAGGMSGSALPVTGLLSGLSLLILARRVLLQRR